MASESVVARSTPSPRRVPRFSTSFVIVCINTGGTTAVLHQKSAGRRRDAGQLEGLPDRRDAGQFTFDALHESLESQVSREGETVPRPRVRADDRLVFTVARRGARRRLEGLPGQVRDGLRRRHQEQRHDDDGSVTQR